MGLFKNIKDSKDKAAGLMSQAQEAIQQAGASAAGFDLSGVNMNPSADEIAAQQAEANRVNKIMKQGIEAPAVIKAIRAVGSEQLGGGTPHEFDVTVTPSGASPYDTTVQQSMLAAQMAGLTEGQNVTVKYDPDDPTQALLTNW